MSKTDEEFAAERAEYYRVVEELKKLSGGAPRMNVPVSDMNDMFTLLANIVLRLGAQVYPLSSNKDE